VFTERCTYTCSANAYTCSCTNTHKHNPNQPCHFSLKFSLLSFLSSNTLQLAPFFYSIPLFHLFTFSLTTTLPSLKLTSPSSTAISFTFSFTQKCTQDRGRRRRRSPWRNPPAHKGEELLPSPPLSLTPFTIPSTSQNPTFTRINHLLSSITIRNLSPLKKVARKRGWISAAPSCWKIGWRSILLIPVPIPKLLTFSTTVQAPRNAALGGYFPLQKPTRQPSRNTDQDPHRRRRNKTTGFPRSRTKRVASQGPSCGLWKFTVNWIREWSNPFHRGVESPASLAPSSTRRTWRKPKCVTLGLLKMLALSTNQSPRVSLPLLLPSREGLAWAKHPLRLKNPTPMGSKDPWGSTPLA